jgi:hypothetical protein
MGGIAVVELVVARSQQAAAWIESVAAYPSGVEFQIEVRWRPELFEVVSRGAPWHYRPSEGGELPDELFRAGFAFADGSRVTTLATGPSGATASPVAEPALLQEPEGPRLMPRGGTGGGESWSHGLWLWPMPQEGPLSFVCEWPALGIALTRTQIDLTAIHEAAGRNQLLWEDNRPAPHGPGPVPG